MDFSLFKIGKEFFHGGRVWRAEEKPADELSIGGEYTA
jgi:hypothetical protein